MTMARVQDPDGNLLYHVPLEEAQAEALKGLCTRKGITRRGKVVFEMNYAPGVVKRCDPSTLVLADTRAYMQLIHGEQVPRRRRERLHGYAQHSGI